MVIIAGIAQAETAIIDAADGYIATIARCENKESWTLRSEGYDPDYCTLEFDLREGWKVLSIDDGEGSYRAYYYFSDEEIISAFFHMITLFDELEESLPEGKALQCKLLISDEQKYVVTSDTIDRLYSWIRQ